MILPDFILPSRVNQVWNSSGIDSLDKCRDKKHFKNYPNEVLYHYNSRGFRDAEWPNDLSSAVWCFGDSFTVGLGAPFEYIWTQQLEQALNCRTINVSMDGASNQWIARKVHTIIDEIAPKVIVIQWSYIHRDELPDTSIDDEARRRLINKLHLDELWEIFIDLVHGIEKSKKQTRVIHSFIPNFADDNDILNKWEKVKGPDWPVAPKNLTEFNNLPATIVNELKDFFKLYKTFENYYRLYNKLEYVPELKIIDLARDGLHYDKITATNFVGQLVNLISLPHQ
jgi:hypothetical protein